MLPKFVGIAPFELAKEGAEEAARENGDSVEFNGPTKPDPQAQVEFINNIAAQKFDAILISANDPDAVAPALKQAASTGTETVSFDSDVALDARKAFASAPDPKDMGDAMVKMMHDQLPDGGEIAILTTTPTATNQNTWIKFIEEALKQPENANLKVVAKVYGNDDDAESAQKMEGLLKAHPDLKGVISPTAVGIAAAARVLEQHKKCDIVLTGTGLPSMMKSYVDSGCVKTFALWDFTDMGYLAAQLAHGVLSGELDTTPGTTFTAGRLGERTIQEDGSVYVGEPLVFTKDNIDDYKF